MLNNTFLVKTVRGGLRRYMGLPMQETQEMWVRSLGGEDPWRKKWQPTPVFFAGKSHIQREPGGLQSIGSQRVKHNLLTEQQQMCEMDNENLP